MARPERNTVDYFPFLCKEGKAMYYIEQKYGNDGYASWVKILRQLAVTNYHYLNLSSQVEFMYLSSKCKVSEESLNSIISDLCEMGEFDKLLWLECRIIWSNKFVDHIKDAYLKRNNKCMTYEGLLTLLDSLGVRKLSKSRSDGTVNAQSKVKKRKEDIIGVSSDKSEGVDFVKFIEVFNSFANKKYRVTEPVKKALTDRLKIYTKAEILKAIENAHKDPFHIANGFKYLDPPFMLRPDKIEKFLNFVPLAEISHEQYHPRLAAN